MDKSDTEPKSKFPIRRGLPRCIYIGQEGFERLNKILKIARRHRKAILESRFSRTRTRELRQSLSKEKRLRAGERDRKLLNAVYSDPVNRIDLWEQAYELLERKDDEHPNNLVPSIEHIVLSDLYRKFSDNEVELDVVSSAFSDWPDLIDRISDSLPWAHFAASTWAHLNHQILHLDDLTEEEKEIIAIQIFAISTIVNDVRLLAFAANRSEFLADEFSNLLENEEATENSKSSVVEIESNGETRNLRAEWNQYCKSIAKIANKIGGSEPNLDGLTEIKNLVWKLESIEGPLRNEIENPQLSDVFFFLDSLFNRVSKEPCFEWLNEEVKDEIGGLWKVAWKKFTPDSALNAINDLKINSENRLEHVRKCFTNLNSANQVLERLGEDIPSDFMERQEWEENRETAERELLSLKSEFRAARLEAFNALKPSSVSVLELDDGKLPTKTFTEERKKAEDKPHVKNEGNTLNTGETNNRKLNIEDQLITKDKNSDNSQEIDTEICQESEIVDVSHSPLIRDQIIQALLQNPPKLAYSVQIAMLARELDELSMDFPITALEATLYSNYLRFPDLKIATALRNIFENLASLSEINNVTNRDVHALMTLAATLRPSLLAPHSGAIGFLSSFQTSNLGSVYRFTKSVSEKAQLLQGIRIDSSVLRGARTEASWDNESILLKEQAETWRKQAQYMTMLYGPATSVWQHWLKSNGLLGDLISNVFFLHRTHATDIDSTISQIVDRKSFEELVRKTDRRELNRKHGEDIHARALDQLHNHALQAVDLIHRKLSLDETRPNKSDFLTDALNNLRSVAEKNAPDALFELEELARGGHSLLSGAANIAAFAINRFLVLFDPTHKGINREPNPELVLSSGLFDYIEIPVTPEGTPLFKPKSALQILLNSSTPDTQQDAFIKRLEKGDLYTSQKILDWTEIEEPADMEILRSQFKHAYTENKHALRRLMNETREKVESALALGHLSDADRNRHDAVIVSLERLSSEEDLFRFDHARKQLFDIQDQLQISLHQQKEKAKNDLERLNLNHDKKQFQLIMRTIERGDIVSANELIDRLLRGESEIRENSQPRIRFDDFFPSMIKSIDKALENERNNFNSVIGRIRRGETFAGLNFGTVTGARRDSAARMLKCWHLLKKEGVVKSDTSEKLRELFSELGFRILGVKLDKKDRVYCEVELRTEPIEERDLCPVPAYGSIAAGTYRIVILWGRPTVEDILQFADDRSVRRATIVLFMGRLKEDKRREIAQITRERTKNLLVIDENLLIFLCAEKDSRIPTLFECALPFTYVQPYVTTAGLLPPEMFYGREQEMRDVADPSGPCFIYGGRQLGKTALLRSVERKVHQPTKGHYALWMDLKGEGIGYDRGPSEIWPSLCRSLIHIGAISNETPEPNPNIRGRVDGFIDYLRSHYSKNSGRTLLLLLDEADRFLEVDAREEDSSRGATGYRESSRLKGLMDATERSIKVVFAGLHNVLRTVEYSNHPLGHFGQPIQIGPLLSNGAWKSAEALLREPMLASGYTFDPPNLITRVLAQTNYYPSLIQLYGFALIKAMVPQRTRRAPLYPISEEVLDETYQSRNLRDMIRSRFHLTLQLDPRYEVIAYAIAYHCVNHEDVLIEGLDQKQVDDAARGWWPEGFRDIETGTDRFRSLLDEMVGLGVLRTVEQRRYTLRNPNLLLLMGNEDEIADNLLRTREPPQEFEPELFRARNPLKPDDHTRSPLTFHQERSLRLEQNSVTVLCGFPASGLNDVLPFLQARYSEGQVVEIKNSNERREFEEELKRLDSARKEGTTIYVVSQNVPWSEHWVDYALKRMPKLHAKGRYAHVLFLTDANHLWQLQNELEKLSKMGLRWLSLRPWREDFLRQWMEDVGLGDNPDTRAAIKEVTGMWPGLIMKLHELTQKHDDIGTALNAVDEIVKHCSEGTIRESFGVEDSDARRVLQSLAIFGEANFEELLDEVTRDCIDEDTLRFRLDWAERLHIVHSHGKGRWEIDSVAAKLIS